MITDRLLNWFLRNTAIRGVHSLCDLPITISTDIGLVRKENQDRVAVMRVSNTSTNKAFVVAALADGMGGMIDGSECASRTLACFFNSMIAYRKEIPAKRLELAARDANSFVYDFAKGKGGATLSAIVIQAGNLPVVLNIGDSRIYATESGITNHFDLIRLTTDDTLEEAVGGTGRELLQFVGMGDGISPHVKDVPSGILRFFISSDGVHFIPQVKLKDVLTSNRNRRLETDVNKLNKYVRQDGAPDNASMILLSLIDIRAALAGPGAAQIEIYDPFCALHVLWIGKAHNKAVRRDKVAVNTNENKEVPKTKKEKKKGKETFVKLTKQEGPQLTLDVD